MKKKVMDKKVSGAFTVIGVAVILAFIVFICVHVSLTIHHTAVLAARNDWAINGIIDEQGGRRAWTDGSYIEGQDVSMWELEIRTIELLQVLYANRLTEIGKWPETPRSLTWSTKAQEGVISGLDVDEALDWWAPSAFTVGKVTIHGSGEVDYPGDVSEAAKEFWEAVIEAFPDIDWGSKGE